MTNYDDGFPRSMNEDLESAPAREDPGVLPEGSDNNANLAEPVQRSLLTTRRRWAFDSLICGIMGVGFSVVGITALSRAGLGSPLSEPRIEVLGYGHTALLGLIEVGIGVLLLIAATLVSRAAAAFLGIALAILSLVAVIEAERYESRLGIEAGFAWLSFMAAVVILASAMLIPRVTSSTTHDIE